MVSNALESAYQKARAEAVKNGATSAMVAAADAQHFKQKAKIIGEMTTQIQPLSSWIDQANTGLRFMASNIQSTLAGNRTSQFMSFSTAAVVAYAAADQGLFKIPEKVDGKVDVIGFGDSALGFGYSINNISIHDYRNIQASVTSIYAQSGSIQIGANSTLNFQGSCEKPFITGSLSEGVRARSDQGVSWDAKVEFKSQW
jgi:hypothetical protein